MQPLTVSTDQLLYTLKEKGGKPDRKPYPLAYGSRNPYRNLKSENSQDYAQNHQRNCAFMNLALDCAHLIFNFLGQLILYSSFYSL
jgi:hypothetical protein